MSQLYYPNHLNIETSDYCNRSCSYCPIQHKREKHPPRLLDMDVFASLLRELQAAPHPLKISLQWIDEPLANPQFFEYIALGRELLPEAHWLLQTNGDFLTAEKLAQLKPLFRGIAVNLYSEKAYDSLLKKELNYVPAKYPLRIQSPGRLVRAKGFDHRADEAIVHINEKFHDHDWVKEYDKVQRAYSLRCMRLWVQTAIGYDGSVYLCCRDNYKQHPVGNLKERSLLDCYNSPKARALREEMAQGRRDQIGMCKTCPGAFFNHFQPITEAQTNTLVTQLKALGREAPLSETQAPGVWVSERMASLAQSEGREEALPASAEEAMAWVEAGDEAVMASWKQAVQTDARLRQLPYASYNYETARRWAKALGHVILPGYLPYRYEVVVGLTPALMQALLAMIRHTLGQKLLGVWVCGSRVITRTRLFALDPSVFYDDPPGGLKIGKKDRLRVFGPHVQWSSDMDLKVLVDETQLSVEDADTLGKEMGKMIEDWAPHIPLSGHVRPFLRLLRVPATCQDAREAFDHYNDKRMSLLSKGPLSLEYVQLLFDPVTPVDLLALDVTEAVRGELLPMEEAESWRDIEALTMEPSLAMLDGAVDLLRRRHGALGVHQLLCALEDFPSHAPRGVVIDEEGRVLSGHEAVWAAKQAGHTKIPVQGI